MRFFRIPPLSEALEHGFSVFADDKDTLISLTPLYLLAGISFPLWMPTSHLELLPLMSGVLTVGLGDSAASFCGTKWGKNKWPGSEKSIEGTAACIASQLLFIYSLAALGEFSALFLFLRKKNFQLLGRKKWSNESNFSLNICPRKYSGKMYYSLKLRKKIVI